MATLAYIAAALTGSGAGVYASTGEPWTLSLAVIAGFCWMRIAIAEGSSQ